MSRYRQVRGERGSLRWIQEFVNHHPGILESAIVSASDGRIKGPIEWRSPLADDDFAEYRDDAFLELLDIELGTRPLAQFWPRLGPQWDALALDASRARVLVEAKANIPEVISSPTAAGPESKVLIDQSLREVATHLNVETWSDWSGTFYQYANRLAHLYLLHKVNRIDTWLVFAYFVGDDDVDGPDSEAEWKAAIQVLHGALGLKSHPLLSRVVDVFLHVNA